MPAYDFGQEVNDLGALDELVMDPDEMRMQALLIRERILGPVHPDTSYYIRFRGAVYADSGRFDRCIELWTYALSMQQNILEPLNPMTQSSLLSFAELFSFMLGEAGRPITRGRIVPPIETSDMLIIFKKSIREVQYGQRMLEQMPTHERDSTALNRALVISLHLACLLARLLDEDEEVCCDSMKHQILRAFYELVSLKVGPSQPFTIIFPKLNISFPSRSWPSPAGRRSTSRATRRPHSSVATPPASCPRPASPRRCSRSGRIRTRRTRPATPRCI